MWEIRGLEEGGMTSTNGTKENEMATTGEYRVGISFNPTGNKVVDKVKRAAADFIDLVESIANVQNGVEVEEAKRLKALAMTHIEDAAMWAVKAATKPTK